MNIMGWIGNFFIIVGLYKVGDKVRSAFIWTMIGEACFAVHTGMNRDWPIFVAVLIFFSLAVLNWWKWGKQDECGPCKGFCFEKTMRPPETPKNDRKIPGWWRD